ncbi:MAG: GPW/gp25 family protein, partial [Pseudomonadota bacterium]
MSAPRPNRRLPPPPTGWPLLPVPKDGSLVFPSLDDSVRQMIKLILLTRPGEQLLRPQFGAGLEQFLHAP